MQGKEYGHEGEHEDCEKTGPMAKMMSGMMPKTTVNDKKAKREVQ